jgi:cytochrome o ubiquinol oxidase subunit II
MPTETTGLGHRRRLSSRVRSLARPAGRWTLLLASGALASCGGVLDPQGPVGQSDKSILVGSVAIMLAIIVPVILVILGFAWWYRASNLRARYRPDFAYSGQLELIVWAIPLLTIILLGGVAWIGSHDLDPAKPLGPPDAALEVEVVSLDWKWLFIYPEQHVASVNKLVIPSGVPIHFTLTSASVMNAFFVPQLGSMIYTMNGMATQLYLHADRPGTYAGLSSHYSGDGFSGMHFEVEAMVKEGFDSWVASTRGSGPTLDAGSYAELAKQSQNVAPMTYGVVAPDLFEKVVMQALPPGPGPIDEVSPGASKRAEN